MAVENIINAKVDLAEGVYLNRMGRLFAQNDQMAHVINVSVYRGGYAVDLTGTSIGGSFIRADDVTVNIGGTVSGNVATITLPANCYTVIGHFSLLIRATGGGVGTVTSIFRGDGFITQTITGTVIDPQNILPTIEELEAIVEGIDIMDGATDEESGQSGLVPTPQAGDNTKFLRGDGEWADAGSGNVPIFSGATSEADGTPGLVPSVTVANRFKYLRGDGSWSTPEGGGGGGSACKYISVTIPINQTGEFPITYWQKSINSPNLDSYGFLASLTFSDSDYNSGVFVPLSIHIGSNTTYGSGAFFIRVDGGRIYVWTKDLPKADVYLEGLIFAGVSTLSVTPEVIT